MKVPERQSTPSPPRQPLVVLPDEELRQMIFEAVHEALAQTIPEMLRRGAQKEKLTNEELMEMTGWSKRTLQNLRNTNQIEFEQFGRTIWYPRASLDRFFESCRVNPKNQAKNQFKKQQ